MIFFGISVLVVFFRIVKYLFVMINKNMSRLLICSEHDISSVNMRAQLLSKNEWEDQGSDGRNSYCVCGNDVMLSTPDIHIHADDIDDVAKKFGIAVDDMIFMSRHKAASAIPTLTVHPIGNYKSADLGGKVGTLVKATPALMTDALRKIAVMNDTEHEVSFEVTHHGPYVNVPTMFIEIGSDESRWGDIHAAEILANVITMMEKNGYPNVVGIGGGHYAPRFTEISLKYKINFGHMIPNYQLENSSDDDIIRMLRLATEGTLTKMVYIHKKAIKKSEVMHISDLIESIGLEIISSKDLEFLV